MKKHPTEASDEDLDIARDAWEHTAKLVDSMLDSAALEDPVFIERLKGAFSMDGISLRCTFDFHGDGRVSKIQLSSIDRKGRAKTVSTATFKATPDGEDRLQ